MKDNGDSIHVIVIRKDLSDDYNCHTGAMMASAMINCSKPIIFHVLHGKRNVNNPLVAEKENIDKYNQLVKQYHCEVKFHLIVLPDWINSDNVPHIKDYSSVGLYRFFIPEITDADIAVTLGSDMIVCTDLAELISLPQGDWSIAGAKNPRCEVERCNRVKFYREYYESVGWDVENGINADMTIFNLKKIRQDKLLPDGALNYLSAHKNTREMEQEVFNIIFKGKIYLLDEKYNLNVGYSFITPETRVSEPTNNTILHWCGLIKPWDIYTSPIDLQYWYYLSLTPWGSDGKAFLNMKKVLPTTYDISSDIDKWIGIYSIHDKKHTLWNLTLPLYIKIIKRYFLIRKARKDNQKPVYVRNC